MKKIVTLLFLLGMVCTASAAKLYIKVTSPGWWGDASAVTAISFDGGTKTDMTTVYMYGDKWAVSDIPTSYTSIKIYRHVSSDYYNETDVTLTGTGDFYKSMNDGTLSNCDAPTWNYLVFRQNIINWEGNDGSTWNDNDMHNTLHPDGDTFIFELTKTQIDNSTNKAQGIRFRLRNSDYLSYNDAGTSINGYPQIYPTASGASISIGDYTTTYYHNSDDTEWSWQVDIPSYDYTKIVLTAEYVNDNGYKWKISADAYLPAVTTNASGYCTYTIAHPLKISGAKAYYATDDGDGSATAHAITNPAASTPMLIKGTASTAYSFAVATSGTDYSSTNAFKAGTATTASSGLASETDGKYNYILNGDAFYAANGKKVAEGKAYLQLSKEASARPLIFADEEDTAIRLITTSDDNTDATYNLSGQRIATPSKGLYIVNGRKVIMK